MARHLRSAAAALVGVVVLSAVPARAAVPAAASGGSPAAIQAAAAATAEGGLTLEQQEAFLSSAKVVKTHELSKGVTHSLRVTLSDGDLTHDAAFQSIDETRIGQQFSNGRTEMRFRDYWGYNVAAYHLAKLIGWPGLVPASVERRIDGKEGALVWWVPVQFDEEGRRKQNAEAPDAAAWSRDISRMRLFTALTADTDRNLGNMLISPDWHMVLIDFSRAFRLRQDFDRAESLRQVERGVLERLRTITRDELKEHVGRWLTNDEVKNLHARCGHIVEHFDRLIAERGEAAVLLP